jgi:hypothetical protein
VDRPDRFLQKLFSVARHVIVSVPYEWPEGSSSQHVQDPVDREKLCSWGQREPNYHQVVTEPFADRYSKKARRLVAYYDVERPDRAVTGAQVKARQPQA